MKIMRIIKIWVVALGAVAILLGIAFKDTGSRAQSNAAPNKGYSAIVNNGTIGRLESWQYGGDSEVYETGGSLQGAGTIFLIVGAVMIISALCIKEEKHG